MAINSTLAVFVTAETASLQELNRVFLLIQEDSAIMDPDDRRWLFLTSKNLPSVPPQATEPPLIEILTAFAGMSLAEINAFVRAHQDALERLEISAQNWLVIDHKGLATSTCLVCEQFYDIGNEDEGIEGRGLTDEYHACRTPYEKAWSIMINLDIGNMHFVDWVDRVAGEREDGSWNWMPF
ncbi:hypothetical protein FB451DRAFT_1099385 [Mycena latifolia]|nr:hypothetical protein FB451DRAFT_1099385 [Mycena latifolia]